MGAPESRNPFAAERFPRYWGASIVAGVGLGIQTVTVPVFIRDRVDGDELRAAAISAVLVAQTVPGAMLALLGGVVAERVERRRILVCTYAVVSAVSLAYVALARDPGGAIWPVFPLAAIVGSAAAFTNPARQSMVPQLVNRTQLQNGVIYANMGSMAALQFLGPTAAGFGIDGLGLAITFALQALLLLAAALLFAGVSTPVLPASGAGVASDLIAGLRYVRSRPGLLPLLLLGGVVGIFFIGPFSVTVPILVPDLLGGPDRWVGILWGCFGAGVFAGSVALTLVRLPRRGLAVILGNLAGGLTLCAYSQSRDVVLSGALLVIWGLGAALFINYVITLLQEHTEPAMMGRVMSMYTLTFFSTMPIGYAQAGWVTHHYGIEAALLSSGVISAAIGLACLLGLRSVRALE